MLPKAPLGQSWSPILAPDYSLQHLDWDLWGWLRRCALGGVMPWVGERFHQGEPSPEKSQAYELQAEMALTQEENSFEICQSVVKQDQHPAICPKSRGLLLGSLTEPILEKMSCLTSHLWSI